MRIIKRYPEILFVLAFLGLAGIAGSYDFEDAILEDRAYCENVRSGIWPDYNGNVQEICDNLDELRRQGVKVPEVSNR